MGSVDPCSAVSTSDEGIDVVVNAGACLEDWALALGAVRHLAMTIGQPVNTEMGILRADEIDETFDREWQVGQLLSSVRVMLHMAADGGPIAMSGPTREVVIGPRVIAELGGDDSWERAERFVALARRVLYPPFRRS